MRGIHLPLDKYATCGISAGNSGKSSCKKVSGRTVIYKALNWLQRPFLHRHPVRSEGRFNTAAIWVSSRLFWETDRKDGLYKPVTLFTGLLQRVTTAWESKENHWLLVTKMCCFAFTFDYWTRIQITDWLTKPQSVVEWPYNRLTIARSID